VDALASTANAYWATSPNTHSHFGSSSVCQPTIHSKRNPTHSSTGHKWIVRISHSSALPSWQSLLKFWRLYTRHQSSYIADTLGLIPRYLAEAVVREETSDTTTTTASIINDNDTEEWSTVSQPDYELKSDTCETEISIAPDTAIIAKQRTKKTLAILRTACRYMKPDSDGYYTVSRAITAIAVMLTNAVVNKINAQRLVSNKTSALSTCATDTKHITFGVEKFSIEDLVTVYKSLRSLPSSADVNGEFVIVMLTSSQV